VLIGITGRKGSGKDSFAAYLNATTVKMADPLKNMLRSLLHDADVPARDIERMIEGDLKEVPCDALNGATPRRAMQTLGTEWAKMIDHTHTLWSKIWRRHVESLLQDGVPVVCTDIRFEHEAAEVRALGGTLIRIVRPSVEATDFHPSEREMEGIEVDETIYNTGTLEDLQSQATEVVRGLNR